MPGVDSLRTKYEPFGVMYMRCEFLNHFFLPLVKDMPIARSAWLVNSSTYFVCILVAINPDHQVHGQTRKVKNYWILVMGV